MPDVQTALERFSKGSLGKLHKTLCGRVAVTFPQYKDRKPVNRQAQKTLTNDIVTLGYCVHNNATLRDLEKNFHPSSVIPHQSAADSGNQTEVQHLVTLVISLRSRLNQLEEEVSKLRAKVHQEQSSLHSSEEAERAQPPLPSSDDSDDEKSDGDNVEEEQMSDHHLDSLLPTFQQTRSQRKKARRHQRRMVARKAAEAAKLQQDAASSATVQQQQQAASNKAPSGTTDSDGASSSPSVADSDCSPRARLQVSAALPSNNPIAAANSRPSVFSVYIGKVCAKNNSEDIKSHISGLGAECDSVHQLRSSNSEKSFRADVSLQHKEVVLDTRKWPSGIRLRPFRDQKALGQGRQWQSRNDSHHDKQYRRHNYLNHASQQRNRTQHWRPNNLRRDRYQDGRNNANHHSWAYGAEQHRRDYQGWESWN